MSSTIALLTDFGTRDTYVGVMKGVMQHIAPEAHFIDITHEIEPQNVRQAAFALLTAYHYFPPGTVFLVVVDPGVGGARRPIAASAGGYTFVAPDNGVLSFVLAEFEQSTVIELSNLMYQLSPVSHTFHGRDIFAPAAAHLAAGVPLHQFGPPVEHIYKQLLPHLKMENSEIVGQVLYHDHFGNIVTSISVLHWLDAHHLKLTPRAGDADLFPTILAQNAHIKIRNTVITGIHHTYAEVEKQAVLALVGSSGFLEIAVNQGNAAQLLNLAPNEPVILQIG